MDQMVKAPKNWKRVTNALSPQDAVYKARHEAMHALFGNNQARVDAGFTVEELQYLLGAMASDEDRWTTKSREKYEDEHRALVTKLEALIGR